MKYIKLFGQHSQYASAESSLVKPNVSVCEQENEVHYNPIKWKDRYFTLESLEDNNVISLKASNTSVTCTISASTDNGKTWTEYTTSTGNGVTLGTLNTGDKLIIKGENARYSSQSIVPVKSNFFATTKQFEIKGNIMSLISGDSFANADELVSGYTFGGLFSGCTGLTSAENLILPATTLKANCYNGMFAECTNLTAAPELPATTLVTNCYQYMFQRCTHLVTAPELPATILAGGCYSYMFNGCTRLTAAPELPVTTLESGCYASMFNGCTSLTVAPELPAETLVSSCYHTMFAGCTGLTTAPELPATTLASQCYSNMFYNCKSLTTAPELPATTLVSSCYSYMFSGCTNLNYIKAMFTTTPSTTYTQNWVSGVAASGTFVKNSAAEWDVSGINGIPTGWTVETASS